MLGQKHIVAWPIIYMTTGDLNSDLPENCSYPVSHVRSPVTLSSPVIFDHLICTYWVTTFQPCDLYKKMKIQNPHTAGIVTEFHLYLAHARIRLSPCGFDRSAACTHVYILTTEMDCEEMACHSHLTHWNSRGAGSVERSPEGNYTNQLKL